MFIWSCKMLQIRILWSPYLSSYEIKRLGVVITLDACYLDISFSRCLVRISKRLNHKFTILDPQGVWTPGNSFQNGIIKYCRRVHIFYKFVYFVFDISQCFQCSLITGTNIFIQKSSHQSKKKPCFFLIFTVSK